VKIVVGLGNPGREYENTPHNVGFEAIEAIARRIDVSLRRGFRFRARTATARWEDEDLLLVKPLTFMNLSGFAVAGLMRYRKVQPVDLVVVLDDVNLELGRIRVRSKGSSGGHKGLESIIQETGDSGFPRIRIGVGRAGENGSLVEHVLTPFAPDTRPVVQRGIDRAVEAVFVMLRSGVEDAMNKFNGPVTDGAGPERGSEGTV